MSNLCNTTDFLDLISVLEIMVFVSQKQNSSVIKRFRSKQSSELFVKIEVLNAVLQYEKF